MTTPPTFTGFPEAGAQFLRDLAENNNRDWFEANKATFVEQVQQPALALVVALGERVQAAFPPVTYDPRGNGGSLTRIYRDTRFSPDKTPYKTNIAMMFAPAGHKRMAAPGFGLQITPEQVELVAGMFSFDRAQLEAYREAVLDDRHGPALVAAAEQVAAAGAYPLGGQELKRVPRGYDAEHPRAEWLKYKGLHVFSPPIPMQTAHTPALVDAVMAHFHHMAPIQQWLMQALAI